MSSSTEDGSFEKGKGKGKEFLLEIFCTVTLLWGPVSRPACLFLVLFLPACHRLFVCQAKCKYVSVIV